ncbi:tandem-95 repeat protein [Thalassolituus sp. LLYu03]|uniref:beta strand repeat-containing protein n=1 Tax=Thalassolituus sp. LLYu03 TaxID=3421656 RepID=UPI003D2CD47A
MRFTKRNLSNWLSSSLLVLTTLFAPHALASGLVIVNGDGAGEGFNDTTSVSAVGGNTETTLGAQRLAVFNKAAEILNAQFDISVTVQVNSQFNPLSCTTTSATLGSAGPSLVSYVYDASISNYRAYPDALANQLQGSDVNSGVEITAQFNSNLGNTGCLTGYGWYLGFDAPTGTLNSLLSVVLHELMHGMGFLSMMGSDGSPPATYGPDDVWDEYTRLLYDATQAALVTSLNQTQRAASALNDTNLQWNGTQTNAQLSGLSAGVNSGRIQMYAPTSYESGSSVSHFDTDVTPNEIMEPQYTEFLDDPGLAKYLLADVGWTLLSSNSAPVLASIGNQTLAEDGTLSLTVSATDADSSDVLTYSLSTPPANLGASLSGTTLSFTPTANYHGSGSITVSVSDGNGGSDSETFTVTVTSVNDAPVITGISSQSLDEDNTLNVALSATDVDGDSLTYSVTSAASDFGASISGSTLTFTPTANYNGSGSVTIQVSDGSATDSTSFTLTVNAVNDAPVFTATTTYSTSNDTPLAITLTATDVETASGSLIFSLGSYDSAKVSAVLSGASLTITPVSGQTGITNVDVSVSDGSLSTTATLAITLLSASNQAPSWGSVPDLHVLASDSVVAELSATDPDGDTLTYTVQSVGSGLSGASFAGSTLTVSAGTSMGTKSVTVRVSDGALYDDVSVSVTVYENYELTSGSDAFSDGSDVSVPASAYTFSMAGGDNALSTSLFFDGVSRDELLTYNSSTGIYTLAMPDSGAFAGTYTLTVTDSNGLSATYYFERPLLFTTNVSPFLVSSGALQEVMIEGAPDGTILSLSDSLSKLTFSDTTGTTLTSITAPDDADNFNAVIVGVSLPASQTSDLTTVLNVSGTNIPQSDEALEFLAPLSLTVTVLDVSADPISGASVVIDDDRYALWGLDTDATTNASGAATLQRPPETVIVDISAEGYQDKSASITTTSSAATVTLTASDTAFTLTGIVQSTGFNFTGEAPVITLAFSDGTSEVLSTTSISSSSVRYRWSGDLSVQIPDTITVTHSKGGTVTLDVDSSLSSQTINVTLISTGGESTTTVVVTSSSGGGGAMSYLLLVLGLLLMVTRRSLNGRPVRG